MTARRGLLFAAILVVAAMSPASLAAAQESVYDVDRGHALTDEDRIDAYEEEGVATGDVDGLDMQLTIADDAGDAGLSELQWRSTGRVFLRIDYDEEIERTVRIYLPAEYVEPQLKNDLESAEGDVTADLEPTENRTHTAVTVTLSEPTTVTIPISASRGAIADSRAGLSEIVGNVTGVTMPSLTDGGAEWEHVSTEDLEDDQDDHIPSNATTIQYNAADNASDDEEADWVPVASCDDGSTPVCTYRKAGQSDRVYLLSTTSDPPPVRYREGNSISGSLDAAVNDAMQGADNVVDDVTGFFGGDDGDDGGD
ncbi:MAG: hypothetical protein ACOCQV_02845 [Halolamina sp.]